MRRGIVLVVLSISTRLTEARPLTRMEAAALQGVAATFGEAPALENFGRPSPPEDWYLNTQSGSAGKEDPDGIEGGECSGMVDEACGTDKLPFKVKKMAKDQCKRSFCHPLCTMMTWTCTGEKVEHADDNVINMEAAPKFNILQPAVLGALCAQIKAEACVSIFECCKDDDPYLFNWVEDMSLAPDGIQTMVPSQQCAHDSTNKALAKNMCSTCEDEVKALKFEILEGACRNIGAIPGGVPDWKGNDYYKTAQEGLPPQVESWVPKLAEGKRLSLRERCELFQENFAKQGFAAKVTAMAVSKKVCRCLGCCDQDPDSDQCWFPIGTTYPAPA